jgi:hypothetical protein
MGEKPKRSVVDKLLATYKNVWRGIARPIADKPEFTTAFATLWIALFTIVLAIATIRQGCEARREFQAVERARVILNNGFGQMMELKDFGDTVQLVVYLRNDGRSAAREVVPKIALFRVQDGQQASAIYASKFNSPPHFDIGTTIGGGEPFIFYVPIPSEQAKRVRAGVEGFRVVGRISYWDDFGTYCEPFAAVYFRNPPRFDPLFIPPAQSVCNSRSKDSETFIYKNSTPTVQFHLAPGEILSRNQTHDQ